MFYHKTRTVTVDEVSVSTGKGNSTELTVLMCRSGRMTGDAQTPKLNVSIIFIHLKYVKYKLLKLKKLFKIYDKQLFIKYIKKNLSWCTHSIAHIKSKSKSEKFVKLKKFQTKIKLLLT